jgi:hypothetical protein
MYTKEEVKHLKKEFWRVLECIAPKFRLCVNEKASLCFTIRK